MHQSGQLIPIPPEEEVQMESSPEIDRIASLATHSQRPVAFKPKTQPLKLVKEVAVKQPATRGAVKFPFIGKKPFMRKKSTGKATESEDNPRDEKEQEAPGTINFKFTTVKVPDAPKQPETLEIPTPVEPEVILRERPPRAPPIPEKKKLEKTPPPTSFISQTAGNSMDFDMLPVQQSVEMIPMPVEAPPKKKANTDKSPVIAKVTADSDADAVGSKSKETKSRDHFRKRTLDDMEMLGLDPSDSVLGFSQQAKQPPRVFGPSFPYKGKDVKRTDRKPDEIFPNAGDFSSLKKEVEEKAKKDNIKAQQTKQSSK